MCLLYLYTWMTIALCKCQERKSSSGTSWSNLTHLCLTFIIFKKHTERRTVGLNLRQAAVKTKKKQTKNLTDMHKNLFGYSTSVLLSSPSLIWPYKHIMERQPRVKTVPLKCNEQLYWNSLRKMYPLKIFL